jgi:hypothetical protein
MSYKFSILFWILLLTIIGCSRNKAPLYKVPIKNDFGSSVNNSNTNSPNSPPPINELTIPDLDKSDSLQGVITNKDGFRDDLKKIVDENFTNDPEIKKAFYRNFRIKSEILELDSISDPKEYRTKVREIDKQRSDSWFCLLNRLDKKGLLNTNLTELMSSFTYNTKKRIDAYERFNQALDGTSTTVPDGDICEKLEAIENLE